jgi:hypothetical protein
VADERQACDQFIYGKLRSDAALVSLVGGEPAPRIYSDLLVPQSAVTPFCSFGALSMIDRNALPATVTIFTMPVYWIRCVITGRDMTPAYSIMKRIDAAIRGQFGNQAVGADTYYLGPWFRRAIRTLAPEAEGTINYLTHGAEYESRVQKL